MAAPPHNNVIAGAARMVKASWGTKRTCLSCGARFYDLGRTPIICPKCGAQFEPEAFSKGRRNRAGVAAAKAKAAQRPAPPKPKPREEDVVTEEEGEEDGPEDDLIEDSDELAEEEEVADVVENVEEEEER